MVKDEIKNMKNIVFQTKQMVFHLSSDLFIKRHISYFPVLQNLNSWLEVCCCHISVFTVYPACIGTNHAPHLHLFLFLFLFLRKIPSSSF